MTATNEALLELQLEKLINQWETTLFRVIRHANRSDMQLIGNFDEVAQSLEDSLSLLHTIASSRYVGEIRSRVDEWMTKLNTLGTLIGEFSVVQALWVQLEQIFASVDIQRQLQNESRVFQMNDKTIQEIIHQRFSLFSFLLFLLLYVILSPLALVLNSLRESTIPRGFSPKNLIRN